jgi:hypothetical protein
MTTAISLRCHVRKFGFTELVTSVVVLTLFVNLAFPKAGFYAGSIPITLGYVLLAISVLLILTRSILTVGPARLPPTFLVQIALLCLFALYCIVAISTNGLADDVVVSNIVLVITTSDVLVYVVSVLVVPALSILLGMYLYSHVGYARILRVLQASLVIVIFWGMAIFFSMNVLGDVWGIPYVTTTGNDLLFTLTRSINRGGIYKMVSTYNNGNILGINLLIWLPVLLFTKKKLPLWLKVGARALLLLTLSRTVWLGWIAMEMFALFANRPSAKKVALGVCALGVIGILAYVVSGFLIGDPAAFLFDSTAGGRILYTLEDVSLSNFLPQRYTGILEIVYVWMIRSFGILGVILFVVTWFYPLSLRIHCADAKLVRIGLATYAVLMFSDGAFLYVPTQLTFWLFAGLLFGERREASVLQKRQRGPGI